MNRLSLRNNRLKLETSGELLIILEESREEYTSSEWKHNRKMSTCNRLDLESLRILTDSSYMPSLKQASRALVPLYQTGVSNNPRVGINGSQNRNSPVVAAGNPKLPMDLMGALPLYVTYESTPKISLYL